MKILANNFTYDYICYLVYELSSKKARQPRKFWMSFSVTWLAQEYDGYYWFKCIKLHITFKSRPMQQYDFLSLDRNNPNTTITCIIMTNQVEKARNVLHEIRSPIWYATNIFTNNEACSMINDNWQSTKSNNSKQFQL